jgi:hypothetical protein
MTTVSTNDALAYAQAKKVKAAPTLNAESLVEVATATVTGYDDPYQSPHKDIDIGGWDTGAAEDATENRLFRIERPTGEIVCWGVTRKDSTTSFFYPDVKSQGDFGYSTTEGLLIQNDDIIRVYSNHHIWAMISRVTVSGQQRKRWDLAYTNEGTKPPPVVNMGPDQQQWVNETTNLATFSFDGSASFDWLTGISGGVSAYLWTIPSTATITAGGTTLDNITFTIAAGEYEVSLTITTLGGSTATGRRTIYANDRSSNAPLSKTHSLSSIGNDSTDVNGWEGSFTLNGDVSSVLYPGQRFLFTCPVEYDGVELNENGSFINSFAGYLDGYSITTNAQGQKSTTITLKSPIKICQLLPSATQFMEEVKTPTAWTEVKKGLSDPAYATFYILKYHTTVLDSHDMFYELSIRDLRRRVFGFPSDTINAHLQILGQIMSGDVGCRSDGAITLTQKPNLENNIGREARDNKFTWTDKNVRSRLVMQPRLRNTLAYIIMAGVSYDGDRKNPMRKFAAKAPGKAQAQGTSKTNIPDISLTKQGGAAELYRIIGHQFAYINNPLDKLPIPAHAMWDICEPADPDWHTLNISDSYIPITLPTFGVRWAETMRFRPARVQRQWTNTNGAWTKTINITARVESKGLPGVFHPTYKGEIKPYIRPGGWLTDLNITMPQLDLDLDFSLSSEDGYGDGFAFNDVGLSESSANFNGEKPDWALSEGSNLAGDIIDQCLDSEDSSGGYLVTHDQTLGKVRVYYNDEVFTDPDGWVETSLIINVGSDFHGRARIVNNTSLTLLAIIKDTKVIVYRKPSGGGWSGAVDVGDTASVDVTGASSDFGVAISGATQIVIGRSLPSNGYRLFRATTVAGLFIEVANHPGALAASLTPPPAVQIDSAGNIVVSYDVRQGFSGVGTLDIADFPSTDGYYLGNAIGSSARQDVDGSIIYSYKTRYASDENEIGISYTISRIKWELIASSAWPDSDADPPGAPDYYPPGDGVSPSILDFYSGTLQARILLYDIDGSLVGTTGWNDHAILDKSVTSWGQTPYSAAAGYPDRQRFANKSLYDYTFPSPLAGVNYWELEGESKTGRNYFGNFRGSSNPQGSASEGGTIHFTVLLQHPVSGDIVYFDDKSNDGNHLYTIDGTDTWTDITPYDDNDLVRSVDSHNAMAVYGTNVTAIVSDSEGIKTIVKGSSTSSSWTDVAETEHDWIRVLKSAGVAYMLGGDIRLDVTVDDFDTIQSRIGVWIGSQSIFRDCVTPGYYYGY